MKPYLDIVKNVLKNGQWKENRTGKKALTIAGTMIQHDLRNGFPLLTTKKMAFKSLRVELEFFIKGLRNKKWLQERGCSIWDEWCNPRLIPDSLTSEERKKKQLVEMDLGPIYGVQWRNFSKPDEPGIDQLKIVVDKLKKDPTDRRMVVSAWNPLAMSEMALPPCHVLFHLVVIGNVLNLTWFQRSCDLMLGIPFNLASYALLLELLGKEAGLIPGQVTGMLSDVHIYEDHVQGAKEQINRLPFELPILKTSNFKSIFDWSYDQTSILNYHSHPAISFPIAV